MSLGGNDFLIFTVACVMEYDGLVKGGCKCGPYASTDMDVLAPSILNYSHSMARLVSFVCEAEKKKLQCHPCLNRIRKLSYLNACQSLPRFSFMSN